MHTTPCSANEHGEARAHSPSIGEALALLERPLLAHALALTGGNQLKAARLLGLNRNALRKRCRELSRPWTRVVRRPRVPTTARAD